MTGEGLVHVHVQRVEEVTLPHASQVVLPLKAHYDHIRRSFVGPQEKPTELQEGHEEDDQADDDDDKILDTEGGDHPDKTFLVWEIPNAKEVACLQTVVDYAIGNFHLCVHIHDLSWNQTPVKL